MTTKVLVPGFYTWANKGDAALLTAFLPWLSTHLGGADYVVTSFSPREDAAYFGQRFIDMPTRPWRRFHRAQELVANRLPGGRALLARARIAWFALLRRYLSTWMRLFLRAPRTARLLVPGNVYRVAQEVDAADAVVAVPGGYLNAYRSTNDWWLFHLPTLWLASAAGKHPILGPCSLGPFDGAHEHHAREVLAMARLVLARERPTYDLALSLGVDAARLVQTPDMAFAYEAPSSPSAAAQAVLDEVRAAAGGRPLVGISVREHNYPGHVDPAAMQQTYLAAVAEALGALQADHDAFVVIVPQTEEDARIGAELHDALRTLGVASSNVTANLSPTDLQSVYAELRLLLGTRMHANILAMTVGTPVVAIAYEPKTTGILEAMGLDHWGIWIDRVSGGALATLADSQWREAPHNRERAAEGAAAQRERLAAAGHRIADALDS